MCDERMPPRGGRAGGAKDHVIGALKPAHHERAGWHMPEGVPARGVVARGFQQCGLVGAPPHGKLIFCAEMRDAAEIKYQDRVQRVLPLGAEEAVINKGNERSKKNSCGKRSEERR